MRVLIITDVTMAGGVDTYMCQLVSMAIKRKCIVRVLVSNERGVDKLYAKLYRFLGGQCFRDSISKKNPKDIKIFAVEHHIHEFSPNIIHVICGAIHSALDIRLFVAQSNIPFLFTESLIDENYQLDDFLKLKLKNIYEKTKKVLTVSKNNAYIICNKFGLPRERIITIENGVDVSKVKQRKHLPTDMFRFVTVARLCEQKGIDILINAVRKLHQKGDNNFHVDIWGEGELRDKYQTMINQYEISKYISLQGWCDNITDILCNYDAFILPSRYEGMPISLMEAMAAKLPCIATRVSGIPEVLDDGTYGVLVEPERAQELSKAMEMVKRNYEYYNTLSDKAYVYVCKAHDTNQNMNKVIDIWDQILKDE